MLSYLDDQHLFYYVYFFQYLHIMLEGKNILILLSLEHLDAQTFSLQSHTKPVSIKLLRLAWNAFAYLLSIDIVESASCSICKPSPAMVVCDGTLIGFWKNLMKTFKVKDPFLQTQQPIQGSCHSDHVILKSHKSRKLLLKYSGYNLQR